MRDAVGTNMNYIRSPALRHTWETERGGGVKQDFYHDIFTIQ